MNIFIKNRLLRIIGNHKLTTLQMSKFDMRLNAQVDCIRFYALSGDVLITGATSKLIDRFFLYTFSKKNKKYDSITFVVNDKKDAKKTITSYFKVISAGGGVVYNDEKEVLIMKRLGKWDLPKGKADKGEKFRETAAREVTEECSVEVDVLKKVCTTWHTYRIHGKRMLKRTKWYKMDCLDDKNMAPQVEEDIEELRWMNRNEIAEAMENSYASIRFVLRSAGEYSKR
ncbi:MAG: 8-oxo-dGTP pyrophosphatase MutT (NUDIX family) [Spirosomataceae bacterium]|jgi:8-oxo-dGTP pyrophosphatase MutT (NUDIX family)